MKLILKFGTCIFLLWMIIFISCQKELSCEGCYENNKPPIANAGPDQMIILPIDSVLLNGNASTDPDGTITLWRWVKISGPASANIIKNDSSKTLVKTLQMGVYKFELKVTDNGGLSAKDTVQIIVNDPSQPNRPPVANAGADQTITLPVNTVNLDGSGSTDPDNNITSYVWTKISGPSSFAIANANLVQTQVTNLVEGIYQFELKVTDAGSLFSKDTIQVIVNPEPLPPPQACNPGNRPLINAQLTPIGTLSESKPDVSVGSAGNKIVFAGGGDGDGTSASVDIYDIVTNTWSIAQLSVPRSQMAVTTCGNKIFFAGGYYSNGVGANVVNNIDIYDASTNTWTVAALSVARSRPAAASVGNKVFFAGGYSNFCICVLNTIDIYDLSTDTWSVATLSEARGYLSATTIGDKIYFAGGSNNAYSISNRIDIYDNTTSSWSTSTLLEPKAGLSSIAFGGKIYWAGGQTNKLQISSLVQIHDINTQTSSLACLFEPNGWNSTIQAVEKNNKLVFFTGSIALRNKFDIYDVVTNKWSIGVLRYYFFSEPSIISVNNTIYVTGGIVNGVLSNQVWKLEF